MLTKNDRSLCTKVLSASSSHVFLAVIFWGLASTGAAQESFSDESEDSIPVDDEIVVEGERFVVDTRIEFQQLIHSNSRGARLYKQGKYKEALPYLLAGARTGFKMSQARVGAIFLGGLGGVEKDVRTGLGWLGVASEPITAPEIRRTWLDVLDNVREEQLPNVLAIVDEFRHQYGSDATGTECRMTANTKSFIAKLDCAIEDEYYRFANHDEKLAVECLAVGGALGLCAGLSGMESLHGAHMTNITSAGSGPAF